MQATSQADPEHLSPGARYNLIVGRHQASGVMYRGRKKLNEEVMLAFEGELFWVLVEPEDVSEIYEVKRRWDA